MSYVARYVMYWEMFCVPQLPIFMQFFWWILALLFHIVQIMLFSGGGGGGGQEGAGCYFLVFGKKYLTLYLSKSRKNKFAGIIRQRCLLYLSSFNPRKPQEAEAYLRPHQISSWSFFIKIVGNIFFKSIRNYYYIITIEIFWNYWK